MEQKKNKPMVRLKLRRIEKGFTLKSLSKKVGLSLNSIQKYEKGNVSPRLDNLKALAKALGCEVGDIVED